MCVIDGCGGGGGSGATKADTGSGWSGDTVRVWSCQKAEVVGGGLGVPLIDDDGVQTEEESETKLSGSLVEVVVTVVYMVESVCDGSSMFSSSSKEKHCKANSSTNMDNDGISSSVSLDDDGDDDDDDDDDDSNDDGPSLVVFSLTVNKADDAEASGDDKDGHPLFPEKECDVVGCPCIMLLY
jgi:hypothetical protein